MIAAHVLQKTRRAHKVTVTVTGSCTVTFKVTVTFTFTITVTVQDWCTYDCGPCSPEDEGVGHSGKHWWRNKSGNSRELNS